MPESLLAVPYVTMAGAGNVFAVVEVQANAEERSLQVRVVDDPRISLLGEPPGRQLADDEGLRVRLARELCASSRAGEPRFDGVLFLSIDGGSEADASMEVRNADGSRAAACGNGLRVAGKYVGERASRLLGSVCITTDSGTRAVVLEREGDRVERATATLGFARPFDGGRVRHGARELAPAWIEIGNRHAVLFEPDVRIGEVRELGPVVERSIEGGVNVELVALPTADGGPFAVRVWERGVGETAACGSGACAVAAAARARGLADDRVHLDFPGGKLRVAWLEREGYRLTGDCVELGSGVFELAWDAT